ncbi:hypothetical protein AB3466_17185 [Sphingobacterium thalpophilum]|uniref:hypothetical protein n=1 Tax=Sphingobacterium thalpophilum TaxID=259 RepID=UPI002D78FBDD|nr:hypothetical protein [Sphingobacterium thalpophilum]
MKAIIFRQVFLMLLLAVFSQCHGGSGRSMRSGTVHKQTDTIERTQTVTGRFKSDYRVVQLSAAMTRLLFVLNKGDIYVPENGFFLHLSETDAKRLGTEDIVLIPLFADRGNLFYNYDRDFTFEIVAVPGVKDCYYTRNITFFNTHNNDKIETENRRYPSSLFERSSLRDTVEWTDFSDYRDLTDMPRWIDNLNNQRRVTVHAVGCAETPDGGYTIHDYRSMTIAELAKERLKYLSNSMELLSVPAEDATRAQWKSWLDSVLHLHPLQQLQSAKAKIWSKTFAEQTEALFALDETNHRLIRLHPQPEYRNFEDQQLLVIDPADSSLLTATIASAQQPNARAFKDFMVKAGDLFTINGRFQWGRYTPQIGKDGSHFYKELDVKNLLVTAKDLIMDHSYMMDEYGYILYHKDKTVHYELLCFNSSTGELVVQKSLNKLLAEAGMNNEKIEYLPFASMTRTSGNFPILLKLNGISYHLTVNDKLAVVQTTKISDQLPWHPGYLQSADQALYYDKIDNELVFFSCNHQRSIPPIKLSDQVYDRYILVPDGDDFRFFYEYGDAFTHGIKTILIDGMNFKQIGDPVLLHAYVQLENESSENTPRNLVASKIGKHWLISFMLEQELFVVQKALNERQ